MADPNADTDLDHDHDRTYIRVQPADQPLSTRAAVKWTKRLHDVADDGSGVLNLRRILPFVGSDALAVECCLATRGADDGVAYYLGIAGRDDDADPDRLARLERACETALPRSYDIERVTWHPAEVLGMEPEATAALAIQGTADRTNDWQTPLTPYTELVERERLTTDEGARPPLATVADALADSPVPAVYQALLRPYRDWNSDRADRIQALEAHQDTVRDQVLEAFVGPPEGDVDLPPDDRARIEDLQDCDPAHSFVLTVRAVAVGDGGDTTTPETVVREVGDAFADCDGAHHGLTTDVVTSTRNRGDKYHDTRTRAVAEPGYGGIWNRLCPGAATSPGIVVDAREAPTFVALDGTRLPSAARRGVDPTPDERTHDGPPPAERVARYDAGMPLGRPSSADGPVERVRLPPALQSLHLAWFGRTGAGKTTALLAAALENHAATDGLDLVVAPKGDGFATEYLRAHYARFGDLDDVVYFDCSEFVPAVPFFDVRDELAAGVPRATAVEETVDHYLEILRSVMGDDRFDRAVRAPDVIRYLLKAQFDPVHGDDAFSHRDLHAAARRMAERGSAPAVSDDDLERMLATVTSNRARTFDEIMQGVANRIEKLPADRRLARIFNHIATGDRETTVTAAAAGDGKPSATVAAPTADTAAGGPDTEGQLHGPGPAEPSGAREAGGPRDAGDPGEADPGPYVDLGDLLDEDVVVVLDTGGLRDEPRRVLTLVLLSNLWTALRRRKQRDEEHAAGDAAGDGAARSDDEDNGWGLDWGGNESVDRREDSDGDDPLVNVYLEEAASVVNTDLLRDLLREGRGFDCSVTLAMQFPGQVRDDAPEVHDELLNDVGTVISGPVSDDRGLARRFATADQSADDVAPRLRALSRGEWLTALPARFGERAPQPFVLESVREPATPRGSRVRAAIDRCRTRTRRHAGLSLGTPTTVDDGGEGEADEPATAGANGRELDSALPHTQRLPTHVAYDETAHALLCARCDAVYNPSVDGMRRAIGCCGSLDAVDRDDVPVVDLDLNCDPAAVQASEWTLTQLAFLQVVYNAQQLRYDPLEYDLLEDSMLRLQEYVGIDDGAVDDLRDAGLLRQDGDHPHRLYSVTPAGRDVINEGYRSGTDYGHGEGDLEESSQHVLAVEAGRRWLERAYVDDPDSDVVEVIPYYDLAAVDGVESRGRRLDIAGLDAGGDVVVTAEAERLNNDAAEAIPADFDTMAACEPEAAIWIVMRIDAAHDVVDALADPPDGEPRVEKTYAETTPPQQFTIDQPGLTDIVPVTRVIRRLD
jgi:hypothetical protein